MPKLIARPPTASSPATCARSTQKPLTCVSTGCAATSSRTNSASTGKRELKTLPITSPSTSLPNITDGWGTFTFNVQIWKYPLKVRLKCEGVLLQWNLRPLSTLVSPRKRAHLQWCHIHDYMARAYRAAFISMYMARAYCTSFISTYRPRAYLASVISTTYHKLEWFIIILSSTLC